MPVDQHVETYIAKLPKNAVIASLFYRHGMRYRWLVVLTLCLASIATLSSGTMINVAIPQIMSTLQVSQNEAQWLSSAFLAASTIAMLLAAWCVTQAGARTTVLIASCIFVTASIVGCISDSIESLTAVRVAQGLSAGIITSLAMSFVFHLFPDGEQGLATGITAGSMILAPAIGPAMGGFISDQFSWNYIFLIGVPGAVAAIPMILLYLPMRDQRIKGEGFNWPGLVFITLSLYCLLRGISGITTQNGVNAQLFYAAAAGALFIYCEKTSACPLIKVEVFCVLPFSILALISFTFGAGLYSSTYLLPLLFQWSHQLSPTQAGLLLLPAGLVMGAFFPLTGKLADYADLRSLIALGFLFFAASMFYFGFARQGTAVLTLAGALILGRVGIGLMGPALIISSFRSLPAQFAHQSSGIMNFTRQLGGALGISMASLFLDERTSHHLGHYCPKLSLCSSSQHSAALNHGLYDSFFAMSLIFAFLLVPTYFLRTKPHSASV